MRVYLAFHNILNLLWLDFYSIWANYDYCKWSNIRLITYLVRRFDHFNLPTVLTLEALVLRGAAGATVGAGWTLSRGWNKFNCLLHLFLYGSILASFHIKFNCLFTIVFIWAYTCLFSCLFLSFSKNNSIITFKNIVLGIWTWEHKTQTDPLSYVFLPTYQLARFKLEAFNLASVALKVGLIQHPPTCK